MNNIYLAESPHLVIQGEGNLVGKKMLLFRVSGCNVFCKDCDSPHTWKQSKDNAFTFDDFVEYINIMKVQKEYDYVMITGGAPSLYKAFINRTVQNCAHINFQIEDAGDSDWSSFSNYDNVWFSFSPKIASLASSTKIDNWEAFVNTPKNWICKVVVSEETWDNDLIAIEDFMEKYKIPSNKIYLMPKGIHTEEIVEQSKFLIEKVWENNFNFSTRLHILIYDNKKLV